MCSSQLVRSMVSPATILACFAVRRFALARWPFARRLIVVVWIAGVLLVLVDLYMLDVMQAPKLRAGVAGRHSKVKWSFGLSD